MWKTRNDYYNHMCKIGLPDVIAASMAIQANPWGMAINSKSKMENLYAFQEWDKTDEGFDFWSCIIDCLK
jgi:hypothetical protein